MFVVADILYISRGKRSCRLIGALLTTAGRTTLNVFSTYFGGNVAMCANTPAADPAAANPRRCSPDMGARPDIAAAVPAASPRAEPQADMTSMRFCPSL